MENRAYAIVAGLFTLVFIAIVIASLLWFRGDTRDYHEYLLISGYAVNGLYPQAEVRFRGIQAGKVQSLDVDPSNPRNIHIRISVEKRIPVTHGTYGQLGYQGVTGLAYVMLDDDGSNPAPLPAAGGQLAHIPVRANVLDDLTSAGQVLLRQANTLMERLNVLVGQDNEQRLSRTLDNLEAASAQLEPALRSIPGIAARAERLLSEENTGRIERSLDNMERATASVAPITEDTRRVLASMQSLSQRIDRMADEMSTEVTESTLPRVNSLVDQLAQDSRDLRRVLLQLEREPRSLLFGRAPDPPGPGEPGFSGERR
jgi:phospholipid/cholesterol/gamma-HCH transport system substrate-binding protein